MKKDLVIGLGVGVPVVILMIVIGGGGHSDFEIEIEQPKAIQSEPKEPESKQVTSQLQSYQSTSSQAPEFVYSSDDCSGNAKCIVGKVTQIIDGDTIKVDSQSIRFALASAPELNESGGTDARKFIETLCPVGSIVLVDEDDEQTQGSYGRIIGVITCNGVNLNEELLDADLGYLLAMFCSNSEFSDESWAQRYGCMTDSIPELDMPIQKIEKDCDPSYPDFCIASSPPDLDCGDTSQKRFTVLQPDPHRFDGDKDGIGCES